MINIQSIENDPSTNDVLDWLFYLSKDIAVDINRFNGVVEIDKVSIDISNELVQSHFTTSSNRQFTISSSDRGWHRRGHFVFSDIKQFVKDQIGKEIYKTHFDEYHSILDAFRKSLNFSNSINQYKDNDTNKIENLITAHKNGLKIPKTLISNDATQINTFIRQNEMVITKPVSNEMTFKNDEYKVILFRKITIIDKEFEEENNNKFSIPVLFQQYIHKKYELRIFYLQGVFYTMAIFSQQNEKTKLDFRNYDNEKPNRNVPFRLPESIGKKLDTFMKSINMNCGSIDMIYTPEGEYVFPEVNPVGQYQWLERNCNYPISYHIAKQLMN